VLDATRVAGLHICPKEAAPSVRHVASWIPQHLRAPQAVDHDPPEQPLALGTNATQGAWTTNDKSRHFAQLRVVEPLQPPAPVVVVGTLDMAIPG
jgi:hypothetical protein